MATHEISLEVPQLVVVMNKDIEIVVREDDEILGRLRISKGSIDWIPRKAKYARRLSWARFDALVEELGRKVSP
ncbi:MAG: hypothetical protein ACYDA3_08235 [Gaiellaceae bacterium]